MIVTECRSGLFGEQVCFGSSGSTGNNACVGAIGGAFGYIGSAGGIVGAIFGGAIGNAVGGAVCNPGPNPKSKGGTKSDWDYPGSSYYLGNDAARNWGGKNN